ncbi:hypothetical protein [Vibrio neptunius]|uniref:NYN domain-containing protein n=1 Tax=Vibrio neptunius TaxID=170651 RepID=A0ABS3AA88_9VIBR|nr:hypothetical protein [Vibrio neptunius]MBN3495478.1 hypothetical protein [Vibrio neptunius]MBN3517482.1 hypothetical protein [Vibrio neptunius]MBN3551821.1 hypothetical protein [Vibrio neptunius]MBN3580328.1 hypothetical protein [Vibrio neptunius]MCH9873994.1 hypothetical protein [Vibrio neptunius]
MKTIVYVDGFNFYYGLLRHSPYKWLDLVKLFEQELLPMHDPNGVNNSTPYHPHRYSNRAWHQNL